MVHRIIYDELVQGLVTEESHRAHQEVIERLVAAGAEGVVLGCTEIELLITERDVDVPIFPTTALHVVAALKSAGL